MIFIDEERTEVFGWAGAIFGMRAAKESYDKIDSSFDAYPDFSVYSPVYIGPNDLKLMTTLAKAGSDHGKFLRDIHVQFWIEAPIYFWKELDTYKVSTVRLSESTMHTLMKKEITGNNFSTDGGIDEVREVFDIYEDVIECLNKVINMYREEKDDGKKEKLFRATIQLLPESFIIGSMMDINYATLREIAHSQRATHRLTEWRDDFFKWMHNLPYADELIFS